jgi:hypothetical protein
VKVLVGESIDRGVALHPPIAHVALPRVLLLHRRVTDRKAGLPPSDLPVDLKSGALDDFILVEAEILDPVAVDYEMHGTDETNIQLRGNIELVEF